MDTRSMARTHRRTATSPQGVRRVLMFAVTLSLATTGSALAAETTTNLSAGNGGTADITGDGGITTGDIVTGMNRGSDVKLGDVHAQSVAIDIGALTNQTDQAFSVVVGPHTASANGGEDAVAHGGRPGQPVDVSVAVDTGVDVANNNANRNSNSNENDTGIDIDNNVAP